MSTDVEPYAAAAADAASRGLAVSFAATGYVRGTITPLGASGAWPVVVDARLAGRRIAIGSGNAEFGALVAADELVSAYAADVVDLAAE